MIYVYCTFDKVSEEYSMPWFAKNDNVAKRNLLIASRRENLPLEDIQLLRIGCFCNDDGTLYDSDNAGKVLSSNEVIILDNQDKEDSK